VIDPSKQRTKVFVCYSHQNIQFLERFRKHLAPFERSQQLVVWDDQKIPAGTQWREEINAAIQATKVAVLLVSPDFLYSEFINQHELPLLLAAAKQGCVTILPVLISYCLYEETPLAEFQFVHDPDKPLILLSEGERDKIWVQIAQRVKGALQPSSGAAIISSSTYTHVKKQETQYTPALQEALRMLRDQKFDPEKRASWIFTLAYMIPTLNEEAKRYLRRHFHRIRFYENSDLIKEYVTLVLGLLDDKSAFNDMRAIFQRSHETLPLPLRKQLLEYIAQQQSKQEDMR